MPSMIELVQAVKLESDNADKKDPQLVMTDSEYDELMQELFATDAFLKKKYINHRFVPRIYTLHGVKIILKKEVA